MTAPASRRESSPTRTGIPLRLSRATLDAQRAAEERAARAGGVHADIGQVWTRKADGAVWRIGGAKSGPKGHVFGLVEVSERSADPTADRWIEADPDDLVDHYTFTGCDHDAACCTTHSHHTSPHKGCILR